MVEIALVPLPVPIFDHRPALTDDMVVAAERSLGISLPAAYIDLLRTERNGGPLRRGVYRTGEPVASQGDPWATVGPLSGVGGSDGIENMQRLIDGWDVQPGDELSFDLDQVVLFSADGHDSFLFDYGNCDDGEPSIVDVDVDAEIETAVIEP